MKRTTLHFPDKIADMLVTEAKKRLQQMNMTGTKGGTIRDIICILIIRHFTEVSEMGADEYEQALKEMHRELV